LTPTIHDVARLANTSKSTVSRFLNGQKVKEETKEALERAIKDLNYHRNANARRLVMNKTNVIAVVVDDISNIFYSGIINGIELVANRNGYNCVFLSWTSNYHDEISFLNMLYEGQVDGIILVSFRKRDMEDLMIIKDISYPVVLVGDSGDVNGIYAVDVDNSAGISEVVSYLYRIGHRKIAYISGPDHAAATRHRLSGYQRTLNDLNLDYNPEWVVESDWSNEGGYRAMQKLLNKGGFTSVVVTNDEMAIGALSAIHEHGFSVPRDFSIVGFDDIPTSSWVYPALTTVRQPFKEIGMKAAEGLFEKIDSKDQTDKIKHLLKAELVIRHSCGKI
jgi:DNA-binding LacI/PurR family transcriptional regulator